MFVSVVVHGAMVESGTFVQTWKSFGKPGIESTHKSIYRLAKVHSVLWMDSIP